MTTCVAPFVVAWLAAGRRLFSRRDHHHATSRPAALARGTELAPGCRRGAEDSPEWV
jgi:hypothetical protein